MRLPYWRPTSPRDARKAVQTRLSPPPRTSLATARRRLIHNVKTHPLSIASSKKGAATLHVRDHHRIFAQSTQSVNFHFDGMAVKFRTMKPSAQIWLGVTGRLNSDRVGSGTIDQMDDELYDTLFRSCCSLVLMTRSSSDSHGLIECSATCSGTGNQVDGQRWGSSSGNLSAFQQT